MCEKDYDCKKCGSTWSWCPEDYPDGYEHDNICPLCWIPIKQMVADVYREEGVLQVIRRLFIRLIK